MTSFLPYGCQTVEDDDIAAVVAVLKSEYITSGPAVAAFERDFAARVGARYAVACSSGTAGLHLAALALGLCEGDTVAVPTLTFLATANAARYVGAEVSFADVDPETGLLTAESLSCVSGPISAVFPVHLNGQTVDMQAISAFAAPRSMRIVEDAAHALGTVVSGIPVGSCRWSDACVFSLHAVKTATMGEGGVITTNDPDLQALLVRLRNHGMIREAELLTDRKRAFDESGAPHRWYYEMDQMGFNYRATDIQCALGRSQLGKLGRFVTRRASLVARYEAQLSALAPIVRPIGRVAGCNPGWHLNVVLIDFPAASTTRDEVMARLAEAGIGTQVHYIPVHEQPYYRRRYGTPDLPGARRYYERALSLPLYPAMSDNDVDYVVGALAKAVAPIRTRTAGKTEL